MCECLKGVFLKLSPDPRLILSSEKVERGNNVGEVRYEFSVEVGKTEGLYGFNKVGGFPRSDSVKLLWVHLNFSLTDNHLQEFHPWGVKKTFEDFEGESMFV